MYIIVYIYTHLVPCKSMNSQKAGEIKVSGCLATSSISIAAMTKLHRINGGQPTMGFSSHPQVI